MLQFVSVKPARQSNGWLVGCLLAYLLTPCLIYRQNVSRGQLCFDHLTCSNTEILLLQTPAVSLGFTIWFAVFSNQICMVCTFQQSDMHGLHFSAIRYAWFALFSNQICMVCTFQQSDMHGLHFSAIRYAWFALFSNQICMVCTFQQSDMHGLHFSAVTHIKGFQPRWYISTMI